MSENTVETTEAAEAKPARRSRAVAPREVTVLDKPVTARAFTRTMATDPNLDVKSLAAEVRALKGTADKVSGMAMWNAGILVYNAIEVSKVVGKGEGKAYPTETALATALGYSKAYGSLLKVLGRAIVVLGVQRDSADYGFVNRYLGNAMLRDAVKNSETPEEFRAALTDLKLLEAKAADRALPTKRQARPDDGSKGDKSESKGKGEETPAEERREATLDDVISLLDIMLGKADRETFAAAEDRVARIFAKHIAERATVTVVGEVVGESAE